MEEQLQSKLVRAEEREADLLAHTQQQERVMNSLQQEMEVARSEQRAALQTADLLQAELTAAAAGLREAQAAFVEERAASEQAISWLMAEKACLAAQLTWAQAELEELRSAAGRQQEASSRQVEYLEFQKDRLRTLLGANFSEVLRLEKLSTEHQQQARLLNRSIIA